VNTEAALMLYNKAREYAALTKSETLVDLYCGVGSLTLFVGRDAGSAIGVELERASIKKARDNARRNNLKNIEFICADAASDWDSEATDTNSVSVPEPSMKVRSASSSKHTEILKPSATVASKITLSKITLSKTKLNPDCIIIDPPRKGLSPAALQKILALNPSRIVYVSCDPATLARDLKALDGYSASKICAVDMFPRTANVETVVLLSKQNSASLD